MWEGWAELQERKALNDARNEDGTFSGSFLQIKALNIFSFLGWEHCCIHSQEEDM